MEGLNNSLFKYINNFAKQSDLLDKLGIITAEYMPYLFIAILIILWLINKQNLKNNILYAGYSAIISIIMNSIIHVLYFHPRPFINQVANTLIHHKANTSFPSDHTTFLLSISIMFLFFQKTRLLGIILTILGVIGGVSRIFCGVHYPFDILGALLVSIMSSLIVFMLKDKLMPLNNFVINVYKKITNK